MALLMRKAGIGSHYYLSPDCQFGKAGVWTLSSPDLPPNWQLPAVFVLSAYGSVAPGQGLRGGMWGLGWQFLTWGSWLPLFFWKISPRSGVPTKADWLRMRDLTLCRVRQICLRPNVFPAEFQIVPRSANLNWKPEPIDFGFIKRYQKAVKATFLPHHPQHLLDIFAVVG